MSNQAEFRDFLVRGAEKMKIVFEADVISRLLIHFRLLCKWADRVNLTSVSGSEEMADRLYLDSAFPAVCLGQGASLHDVGTGAGFPGLIIKVIRTDLLVTLTEARRKKVSFLRQAAREMGLDLGLSIVQRRLGWDHIEKEGWAEVMSRAAFPPDEWIRQGSGLVAPGGRLWIFSGPPHDGCGEQEFSSREMRQEILPQGFVLEQEKPYKLPFSGRSRRLVSLRRCTAGS